MGCQQLKSENSSKCSDQNQENVCKTIYLDSDVLYGMHMTTDETWWERLSTMHWCSITVEYQENH